MTLNGAVYLNPSHEIGKIELGKPADIGDVSIEVVYDLRRVIVKIEAWCHKVDADSARSARAERSGGRRGGGFPAHRSVRRHRPERR